MEDFGYRRSSNFKLPKFAKKTILSAMAFISLISFLYVTIFAYQYFYQKDSKAIKIIKSSTNPIKVYAKYKNEESSNELIYKDIFEKNNNPSKPNKIIINPEPIEPEVLAESKTNQEKDIFIDAPLPKKDLEKQPPRKIIIFNQEEDKNDKINNIFKGQSSIKPQRKLENSPNKRTIRVQIAALTSEESAQISWKKLNRLYSDLFADLNYYIEKVNLGRRGIFYRLQIGNFFDQIKAEEFCQKYIAKSGKTNADCIIVE